MGSKVEGIQGQGLAGIWQGSPNFWAFTDRVNRPRQQAAQQALDNERKLRDALINDNRQFAPGKVWEPFYSEVEDYIQTNVRDFTIQNLSHGRQPIEFEGELARRRGEARKLENKINYFKEVHGEIMDLKTQGEKDGYYKPGYYDTPINDFFFNGRQAKPADMVNPEGIENVFNDSRGYNMTTVAQKFMKDLPKKLLETYDETLGPLGEKVDSQIAKTKLGFIYEKDGSIKLDPQTLLPMVTMTDSVASLAMNDPYLRNYVNDNLGDVDVRKPADMDKVKKLLSPILTPYDETSVEKNLQQGFKYSESDRMNLNLGGSGYTVPVKLVEDRWDTLYRITHEYDRTLLASIAKASGVEIAFTGPLISPKGSGTQPASILIKRPNPKWKAPNELGILLDEKDGVKEFITEELSLRTEEDRQKAIERLNTVLDEKLPSKDQVGENLTRFAKEQRKKMKSAGSIYTRPESTDEKVDVY